MASYPQDRVPGFYSTAQSSADDGLPISELLNILRRRRRVVLAAVVLLTGLATLYGLIVETRYTATASVIIEARDSQVVDVEQVLPELSLDSRAVENQIDIIRSHALIDQTMAQLGLYDDPEFGAPEPGGAEAGGPAYLLQAGKDWVRGELRAAQVAVLALVLRGADEPAADAPAQSPEEAARELAIGIFAGNLAIARSGDSSVLTISFTSEDAAKAARIANAMADLYVTNQLREKREATAGANTWLSERLQTLQQEVIEAEQTIVRFQAQNQLFASEGTGLTESQLADLNRELITTRAEKVEKQAKLRLVREFEASGQGLDSIAEVVASPLIAFLRQQASELQSKEAELATEYGERHPLMQALQQEKANLAAGIRAEIHRIVQSFENEVTVLTTREQSLEQELATVKSSSASEDQAAVRLRELEREAAARRGLYETMLARYQETQTQEGLLQPDARAIYPAALPWEPSTPSPKIFAVVGFTASAVFGCMLALLIEQLDKSLRSGRQIERVLQLPCLGLVPKVSGLRRGQSPHGYLRQKQRSTYAVSIRALYTAVLMDHTGPPPKTVLIASALPGEGKTSVASSLAVLAAQSGKKTVLVDLDLWHPQIAREFGVRSACGVGEVLAEGRPLDDALVSEDPSGLDLLPATASSDDPAALIASQRLRWLLDELRGRYEYIVLDSPPLLGPADAEILSLYADATLFVVQWERTKQDAAGAAVKSLRDLSANIAGAVLTQVDLKKHARYRYGDAIQYSDECRKYYIN